VTSEELELLEGASLIPSALNDDSVQSNPEEVTLSRGGSNGGSNGVLDMVCHCCLSLAHDTARRIMDDIEQQRARVVQRAKDRLSFKNTCI